MPVGGSGRLRRRGVAASTTCGGTTVSGDPLFGDGLGADHHASHQFPGPRIRTHHTGDALRAIRTGAKQGPGRQDLQITSIKQNWRKMFSLILITKTDTLADASAKAGGLIET